MEVRLNRERVASRVRNVTIPAVTEPHSGSSSIIEVSLKRLRQSGQRGGQVGSDATIILVDRTSKQDHERQRAVATRKKVHQGLLSDPIDLSQYSLDSISARCGAAAPGRESHLDRDVGPGFLPRNDAEKQPDAAAFNRTDVRIASVEQRTNEALSLQPEVTWKPLEGPILVRRAFVHVPLVTCGPTCRSFRR